jgi:hypothetical protein
MIAHGGSIAVVTIRCEEAGHIAKDWGASRPPSPGFFEAKGRRIFR